MVEITKLHIVYCQNEASKLEVKFILPELYLEGQYKSNDIEEQHPEDD